MKRTYTLIVLLGLVIGTMVTGCNNTADDEVVVPPADTNTVTETNQ